MKRKESSLKVNNNKGNINKSGGMKWNEGNQLTCNINKKGLCKLVMCGLVGNATSSHCERTRSQPFCSQETRRDPQGLSKRWAARGLHLYLLEEGSSFTLDNWLQQRASPLAGGGTLWQVLTSRLHCAPLPLSRQLSAFSHPPVFITAFQ